MSHGVLLFLGHTVYIPKYLNANSKRKLAYIGCWKPTESNHCLC